MEKACNPQAVHVYKLGNYPTPGPRQRRSRGECVGFDFGCHLRLWNDGRQGLDRERFAYRLGGRSAPQAIALVAAFEVVVAQECIEVALDLGGRDVPGLASCDAEALVEERPVHALDEAVGARRGDLRPAVFDAFHRQQQFVCMLFWLAAELAAVVGEDGLDRYA